MKPIQATRKSDFELVYREANVKDDDREDYRRRTNDIRRKTSDIILKEQVSQRSLGNKTKYNHV